MKLSIPLSALLIAGFVAASAEKASAVVYCQYVSYPAGCTCTVTLGVRSIRHRHASSAPLRFLCSQSNWDDRDSIPRPD